MIKYNIIVFTVVALVAFSSVTAQDTAAMIKDFNKVMSFAVAPYLYYSSSTSVKASPVMQKEDTLNMKGVFYKYGNELFYKNEQEEMYLEDSFFIEVNHERKTIWISKVNVATKDKMNALPLSNKELQSLFRKKFTISKEKLDEDHDQLNFESKQYYDSVSMVLVNIALKYSGKTYIPDLLQMNITMKQPIDDYQVQQLKEADVKTAVQTIGSTRYFTRNQTVTIAFADISNSKEKAMQIPSWKEMLNYNGNGNEFSGKGNYNNYEITKTF